MKHQFDNWFRLTKRFAASFYFLNKNRLLGRSFVPHPRKRLFIEPVSFCNLACKFCSYPKNLHPRTVMNDALFQSGIDQAAAMGFENISLTPINGDVFMDKNIIGRMEYIENSTIGSQIFYTNFIGADEAAIISILAMKKLRYMEISVYGHDLDSFRKITGRGEAQYRRLIKNLTTLERLCRGKADGLSIVVSMRTYRSFGFDKASGNALLDIIDKLRLGGILIGLSSQVDNWGGAIDKNDIAGIEMDMRSGRNIYRKGPCGLPFDSIQITATGKVNACACRDPGGNLTLGDLGTMRLADILSPRNDKWLKIIEDHEAGHFNKICASCGFYQSIHDERRAVESGFMTKEEYFSLLTTGPN
jgi:hypothetical protein